MPFEIQWTGHQGAAMTRRDTPVEAVEFAAEMIGKGFADVVILDLDDGKVYAPAEFARFYTNARHSNY
jgi:hypothetical protein